MKAALFLILILSVLSCRPQTDEEHWETLTDSYSLAINDVKDQKLTRLRQRNAENPRKYGPLQNTAHQVEELMQGFKDTLATNTLSRAKLKAAYLQTIDSLTQLAAKHKVKLDSSYQSLPDLKQPEKYMLINLTLIEMEILEHLLLLSEGTICGLIGTSVVVTERKQSEGSTLLEIASEGLQLFPAKYLSIDSILKDGHPIPISAEILAKHSIFNIQLDSLSPGNYKLFGTVKAYMNDKERIENFEKDFSVGPKSSGRD